MSESPLPPGAAFDPRAVLAGRAPGRTPVGFIGGPPPAPLDAHAACCFIQALGKPLHGRQPVLRLLAGLFRRGKFLGASLKPAWVNGQPGAVTYDAEGRVVSVLALDIADGQVQAIRSVVNPDELGHLGPVSDVARRPGRELARDHPLR